MDTVPGWHASGGSGREHAIRTVTVTRSTVVLFALFVTAVGAACGGGEAGGSGGRAKATSGPAATLAAAAQRTVDAGTSRLAITMNFPDSPAATPETREPPI